ncbi:MAG: Mrp/NBP35 family ATP-binding protein [Saprospiraceae bacterium]|nr:Mrp/NBP35 family ATP-binding protein [Bacteroidia bacterium]NNL91426.1 Mrp/NBP35 family ATP-binding protein [Saprospiraceae bacterium]
MIDNNKIVEILRGIQDPNSGNDLISMRLIDKLKVRDNSVSFSVNTSGMADAVKFQLHEAIAHKIKEEYPNANVDIHFTTEAGKVKPLAQVKNIIAVASGKGGVGKSTVSTNLALGLKALGAKVGLMDADLYGPSIPTMLGIKDQKPKIEQLYGKHRIRPIEKFGIYTISIGNIVEPEQAVVLRGPRLGGIIKQFVNDVTWPELDYLIIDLPPGTGDIQLTLVQTVPITAAVMVTTPQDVAVADAIKAMNMFRLENINVPIIGIVENMSWFIPDDMPEKKYKIFGEGGGKALAKESKSVLLAQLPLVTDIRKAGDQGIPIVLNDDHLAQSYYIQMAQKTAQQLAVRNEMLAPTQIVGVNVQAKG